MLRLGTLVAMRRPMLANEPESSRSLRSARYGAVTAAASTTVARQRVYRACTADFALV